MEMSYFFAHQFCLVYYPSRSLVAFWARAIALRDHRQSGVVLVVHSS